MKLIMRVYIHGMPESDGKKKTTPWSKLVFSNHSCLH